jgi:hypothetical protein
VAYLLDKRLFTVRVAEGQASVIPPVPPEGVKVRGASQEFRILAARWGVGLTWTDVTDRMIQCIDGPNKTVSLRPLLRDLPDPWFGKHKRLAVWFDHQGVRYVRLIRDDRLTTALLP